MMDSQFCTVEIEKIVEICTNQLYFAILKKSNNKKRLKSTMETFYFSIDDELVYQNYYSDFGPLNISCLYKYCYKLNKYLEYAKGLKRVVHCTSNIPEKKANAAFLVGSFSIIYLNMHPKQISNILQPIGPFKPFLDASQCFVQYTIQLNDCFKAIAKAATLNFFNFEDFNVSEYDTFDKLQFGDMNWLVPRKFLAFVGPTDNEYINSHPPHYYFKYFLKNDIKTVIRLNNRTYDASAFTQVGIRHIDLIFPDGTTPPKDILLKFLNIAETAPAAIAVHCKAGLGRTGSLIGSYIIKHYRLSAREAIAWMRICRPGSVIGQQQGWLEKIENWLWQSGSQYRIQRYGEEVKIPRHKYGIYSKVWPKEREKVVLEARKKIQTSFTQSQLAKIKKHPSASSYELATRNLNNPFKHIRLNSNEKDNFNSITKLLSSVHGLEIQNSTVNNVNILSTSDSTSSANTQTLEFTKTESNISNGNIQGFIIPQLRFKSQNCGYKRESNSSHEFYNKYSGKKQDDFAEEKPSKTQGDKLVDIKAARGYWYGHQGEATSTGRNIYRK